MPETDHLRYLNAAGFAYRPAESPLLWNHLESQFNESHRLGSRFNRLPASFIAELIAEGEGVLLDRLVSEHRQKGQINKVTCVIDLPYVVGTNGVVRRFADKDDQLLQLIQKPGTASERLVQILPTAADGMPLTNQVTIEGGLYADGRTTGYFGLLPGNHSETEAADCVYLATEDEIRQLAGEMLEKADDLVTITKAECAAMVERVMKALG